MDALRKTLATVDTLTFDCYGTLIDWEAGLAESLAAIFGSALADRRNELFDTYNETEAAVESEGHQSYGQTNETTACPLATFPDLKSLADAASTI